jgi:hypothetical protein
MRSGFEWGVAFKEGSCVGKPLPIRELGEILPFSCYPRPMGCDFSCQGACPCPKWHAHALLPERCFSSSVLTLWLSVLTIKLFHQMLTLEFLSELTLHLLPHWFAWSLIPCTLNSFHPKSQVIQQENDDKNGTNFNFFSTSTCIYFYLYFFFKNKCNEWKNEWTYTGCFPEVLCLTSLSLTHLSLSGGLKP